jgi:Cdc6-related protein, AAA superfamily ATPase
MDLVALGIIKMNNQNNLEKSLDLNIDKERILSLTFEEKLQYLSNLTLFYPKLNQILEQVEECQSSAQMLKRPLCMRITGVPGSGKTKISEIHKNKYPDYSTADGDEKSVLYSRIPCPAYIGGLASKILNDLGDPFYFKHSSISIATQRLYALLKACKVKIIFLDEMQHLVDRNSQKLLRDSSDWFKELIDETGIPVIFLGCPDSNKIFLENDQLANRVRIVENINPFKHDEEAFKVILHLFDKRIPLKESSDLAVPDLRRRIYVATKGLMKPMHDLIIHSTIYALQSKSTRITLDMLSKAYDKLFYDHLKDNPFESDDLKIQEQIQQIQRTNRVS